MVAFESTQPLVLRNRSSFTKSLHLAEDRVCRRGPSERLRVAIVVLEVVMNRLFQLAHVGKAAPTDAPPRDLGEGAFHWFSQLALVGVKCR